MMTDALTFAAYQIRRGNPARAGEALRHALAAANRAKRPDIAGKVLTALRHVRRMPAPDCENPDRVIMEPSEWVTLARFTDPPCSTR